VLLPLYQGEPQGKSHTQEDVKILKKSYETLLFILRIFVNFRMLVQVSELWVARIGDKGSDHWLIAGCVVTSTVQYLYKV
jgi:hypothetical protein